MELFRHGKGPCDGIGGTSKRLEDDAIKQQKVVIQNANDFFFKWAVPYQSQSAIKYIFVESKEFEEIQKILAGRTCLPVCATMKLHAAFASKDVLWTRATSCYCKECFTGSELQPSCNGWSSDKDNKSTASTSSKGTKTKKLQGDWANLVKAPALRRKIS